MTDYIMGKIFVSPFGSSWKVKNPENSRASGIFDTKAEARAVAIEIAKNQGLELIIQNTNGKIGEKNSYGNDPKETRG